MILETKNASILEKIAVYIRNLQQQEDWWKDLSDNEKNFVQRSAQQIEEDKVVSIEAVKAEIRERLDKW